ncbi:hypothetical protein [Kineosporia sp. NBRC 101731]|uniref:hypothetical protein n=1 Tax=Kineosporia sp. NBRC 101731 TaxID=3032199 RepID=UPI0024A2000B|nr:hypothetical protein [Kineosporia sp. NBRC 101731]GLY32153.1 hypothetical protein Kisp02_55180 [Kineosporia sp. NBRC 101731]
MTTPVVPPHPGPGAGDPFDPFALEDIRTRVVEPVLTWMLREGELEAYALGWTDGDVHDWTEPENAPSGNHLTELTVIIRAGGQFQYCLWSPEQPDDETLDQVAHRFASSMQDWVAEWVRWGEFRSIAYSIPARDSSH